MKFTYYGHACFSVEMKGLHILFDPFITPNELAKHIDITTIKADYIFVSHGHEDHIADVISIASNTNATVVANYEVHNWFIEKGVKKVHPMNLGGSWNFDFGTVKMVNAIHSSVLPDGTYGGNPAGFVISSDEGCFYYAGDTALTMDMKLIPMTCRDLSFCVLPIGNNFTMGVNDAIIAADFVNTDRVIGVHYDTFGYIKLDKKEAIEKFAKNGKELILVEIGKTLEI